MKLHLLKRLACPACRGELEFATLDDYPREDVEIESGGLRCKVCSQEYPIEESIPRFFARTGDGRMLRTRDSFGYEWLRYPGGRPQDKAIFLEETQIPEGDWAGRFVLDAGCGMGRYTAVALSLGAEVVSFDLSESLRRLVPVSRETGSLHVVQGDLLHPPFKRGVFDIVYSQGVIHHTPDAKAAFGQIAALTRRDGIITVWVYGTPGSFESFSSNPVRAGRDWVRRHLRLAWAVVWTRQLLSDGLRLLTTRLPVGLLYLLCHPLAFLGAFPLLKYLTFSVERDFKVRLIENFDWLAPPFQSKHTKEEMRAWFSEAGCEVVRQLPHGLVPKVGMVGRRRDS
ncbi:MAG: methyltransferase domain-containing protein [Elusimicrobiota bacterium]